jgi:hypothetical protein
VKKQAFISCLFVLLASCAQPTFYLCLLLCIFLSTKGAYYGANKQALLLSTFGA